MATAEVERSGQYIEDAEYHSLPGISSSMLRDFMNSEVGPRGYHYKYLSGKHRPSRKKHYDFGTCVHDYALRGDRAGLRIIPYNVLASNGARRGKAWDAWAAENAEFIQLTVCEHKAIKDCVDSINSDGSCAMALKVDGLVETYWDCVDADTKLTLRCKPDKLIPLGGKDSGSWLCIDLKTSGTGTSERAFARSCSKFRYDVQEAFYRRVLAANGIKVDKWWWIVVGSEPPYPVDVYQIGDDSIARADEHISKALADLNRCYVNDDWGNPYSGVARVINVDWVSYGDGRDE